MRRMLESDVVHANDAWLRVGDALESLNAIDLRAYAGDAELRDKIKQAKDDLKDARGRLREAQALQWRRV